MPTPLDRYPEYRREWEARYSLTGRLPNRRNCIRPVANKRCTQFYPRMKCDGCMGNLPGRRIADHCFHYAGKNGVRLWISMPYHTPAPEVAALFEQAAAALDLHTVIHPEGHGWWNVGTALVIASNYPIPDHGYRWIVAE